MFCILKIGQKVASYLWFSMSDNIVFHYEFENLLKRFISKPVWSVHPQLSRKLHILFCEAQLGLCWLSPAAAGPMLTARLSIAHRVLWLGMKCLAVFSSPNVIGGHSSLPVNYCSWWQSIVEPTLPCEYTCTQTFLQVNLVSWLLNSFNPLILLMHLFLSCTFLGQA